MKDSTVQDNVNRIALRQVASLVLAMDLEQIFADTTEAPEYMLESAQQFVARKLNRDADELICESCLIQREHEQEILAEIHPVPIQIIKDEL